MRHIKNSDICMNYMMIFHMVKSKMVLGIKLDSESQPEFCDACTKAKSNIQLYPKESEIQSEVYGKRVMWDPWGPALVQSLQGNSYSAPRIDDTSCKEEPYFLQKKSQAKITYLKDEAYLEHQTGNHIKYICIDRGGEFMSKELMEHQDMKGTCHKLTVHDSPPQNGTAEWGMQT
jgi:hypothetical protein